MGNTKDRGDGAAAAVEATAAVSASPQTDAPVVGVLGGSGLYQLDSLTDVRERDVETPFGRPSGPLVLGRIGTSRVAFLSRHGRGHRLSPSEINYRANISALRQIGVRRLLSISAVGSLRAGIVPGDLVLADQFIDKTHRRSSTFFGDGIVGHVSFAEPVCAEFAEIVVGAASHAGCRLVAHGDRDATPPADRSVPRLHRGGTYVCMEGPQFSTRAESLLHRGWGADVIGMTAATEAKLAREAELCFALLALSTDYDSWHPGEEAVSAGSVVEVLSRNIARAQSVVEALVPRASGPRSCACARATEHAILSSRESASPEARERLRILYGRDL